MYPRNNENADNYQDQDHANNNNTAAVVEAAASFQTALELSPSSPDEDEIEDTRNVQGSTMTEPDHMHRTTEDDTGTDEVELMMVKSPATKFREKYEQAVASGNVISLVSPGASGGGGAKKKPPSSLTSTLTALTLHRDHPVRDPADNANKKVGSKQLNTTSNAPSTTTTATTTGGVGTAGISSQKNADDDDAESFWGHPMFQETTKNPVVEKTTNKNNVQSVSRSHPSPFTVASRSVESLACTIPNVVGHRVLS